MEEKKTLTFTEHTDEELKQLAADLYEQKIFSSGHLPPAHMELIPTIFLPIALGAFAEHDATELNKIGHIYEYMDKAGPRSINGYPTFFSFKLLSDEQVVKIDEYYNQYEKKKQEFLKGSESDA